ncbi:MAG: type II secretory pathway component PulF [Alphaproteobacteria bacterium]|jgi:type II secretory pathway component PulF
MGLEFGVVELGLTERIEFFRTLSSWLTSGGGSFPVNEAIANTCDVFARDEYKSLRGKMERVVRDYNSGQVLFCEALKQTSLGFSDQELAIIKAAEESNQLRLAIPSLVEALMMRQSATKLLKGKMMMPIVGGFMLILMSLGVMVFMLPVVMEPVLQRDDSVIHSFPFIIKYYWYGSVWLRANYWLTAAVAAAPVVIFFARNTELVSPYIERALMGMGPMRRIILAYNAVLVVYFMPALVRSNMPLPSVLNTLSVSLNNTLVCTALKKAAYDHDHGTKLGDALASLPFRGSFRSAVEAGEKTGKIADRVEDLKVPYASEFERITKKATAILMLIVMAGLLPFFIISMYTSLVAPMIALMEYS